MVLYAKSGGPAHRQTRTETFVEQKLNEYESNEQDISDDDAMDVDIESVLYCLRVVLLHV